MTDAPERIWQQPKSEWDNAVEYIRADIAEAKERAAVAAKVEEIIDTCEKQRPGYTGTRDRDEIDRQDAKDDAIDSCVFAIRALSDTDALAEYAKKRAAEAAAYEKSADKCFHPSWKVKTSTDHIQARTAALIRALRDTDALAEYAEKVRAEERRKLLKLIIDAQRCRSCGVVFDSLTDPHTDQDCAKGHASWEAADVQHIADALRELIREDK